MQGKVIVVEIVRGKPYTFPALTPAKEKEKVKAKEKEAYLFDISKADKIFDFLVKDKQIKLLEEHKISSAEEIQNIKFTNNYMVFHNIIQKALK